MRPAVLFLAAGALLAGCSSGEPDLTQDRVLVRSGELDGQGWQLWASADETGALCLEIKAEPGEFTDGSGACGFGTGRLPTYTMSWSPDLADPGSDSERTVYVGPVAETATQVAVSGQTVDTFPLPGPLGPGNLFVAEIDRAEAGGEPVSLDVDGKEVPAQSF